MVLEIADNPDAAMDKEQHTGILAHTLRLHDVELHCPPILVDGLLGQYLRAAFMREVVVVIQTKNHFIVLEIFCTYFNTNLDNGPSKNIQDIIVTPNKRPYIYSILNKIVAEILL